MIAAGETKVPLSLTLPQRGEGTILFGGFYGKNTWSA